MSPGEPRVRGRASRALLFLCWAALAIPVSSATAAPLVTATVDTRQQSLLIPSHFQGLVYDYSDPLFVTPQLGLGAPFAGLVHQLAAQGGGAPTLRVGAATADRAWWPMAGVARPPGVDFDLTPGYLENLRRVQAATGSPLVLDLNMGSDMPSLAATEASQLAAGLPRRSVHAFNIGQRPDTYGKRVAGRRLRTHGWSFGTYLRQLTGFLRALKPVTPIALAAPNACCGGPWRRGLPRLLRGHKRGVRLVTYQDYALSSCSGRRQLSPKRLISRGVLAASVARVRPLVKAAHGARRHVEIDEANTDLCGNRSDGVSDRFASALWGVNWLYTMAAIRVHGVDFRADGQMAPFRLSSGPGTVGQATVRPLYYGMLMFAMGTANRARMLLGATFGERFARGKDGWVWATVDRRHTVRVTTVNLNGSGGTAAIRMPRASRTARLILLTASGPGATGGVRLGGQAIPSGTTTGRLTGRRVLRTVRPSRGVFRFRLPPFGIALLTAPNVPR